MKDLIDIIQEKLNKESIENINNTSIFVPLRSAWETLSITIC